jgi:hypothetical protein
MNQPEQIYSDEQIQQRLEGPSRRWSRSSNVT